MGNISSKFAKKVVVLPEVEFSISTTGMTIYSKRFKEPRYLEFEKKGKCRCCKSGVVDIEYVVDPTGVEIYCSRFDGPRRVMFDDPCELPQKCIFRVKTKGQSYIIPYNTAQFKVPENRLQEETMTNEQPMEGQQNDGGQNLAEPREISGEQSAEKQPKEEL
jgi:hypothetical protein